MARQKIAAANWKMHKTPEEAKTFLSEWQKLNTNSNAEIVIFPPAYCLEAVANLSSQSRIQFGPQNVYFKNEGAFTGEISPSAVTTMGARYALIGHSERRTLFAETNDTISKKVQAAVDCDLCPMLCIGETLSERESGRTNSVLDEQLTSALKNFAVEKKLVIAYEPVWAIGTGKVATPEMAEEAHVFVRQKLEALLDTSATPILYGGSVKPDSAKSLASMPNIDGFLVGGASLDAKSFSAICSVL